MERIIILDKHIIPPFAESARDLRILNKPLWLLQRDILKAHCKGNTEISSIAELATTVPVGDEELLAYRDNLFFNSALIDEFIAQARRAARACRLAFRVGDRSIDQHALQLADGFELREGATYLQDGEERRGDVRVVELYYFPAGRRDEPVPLVIDTLSHEMGYYRIPSYMAKRNNLTYQIPLRACLSVESWLHVFLANILMGVFTLAAAQDVKMGQARLHDILRWGSADWQQFFAKLQFSLAAAWERVNPFEDAWRNHFLASRALVKVGKRCSIDPTAVIHGPTVIGDDCYIGPGVVIANSYIGSNVNIMQGSQVMLSVVSDRCFLPFNAGLFMTTLMENSMVAQNSTLQLCVVGRNTFIGANNCFTDFNLQNEPIKIMHRGRAVEVNMPVLGSAVGHNVKVGSGFVVYPGRMIESNAVIIFDDDTSLIRRTVPGHDLDDTDDHTGEPRRIVYHWPHIYDDPADRRIAAPPQPGATESGADEAPPPAPGNGTHAPEAPGLADEAAVSSTHDRPAVGMSASARRSPR